MAKQSELSKVLARIDAEIVEFQAEIKSRELAKAHILQVQAQSQARERGRTAKRKRKRESVDDGTGMSKDEKAWIG